MADIKQLSIRNSTVEFLVFQVENQEEGIQVYYQDETVWLTQKAMATLLDVSVPAVNQHLKNIYDSGELMEDSTIKKNLIVQKEGNREVSRNVDMYNLDAVISVGYRVNSIRATQFRQWCTDLH